MIHNLEIKENKDYCKLCCTKITNFNVSFADTVILKDINIHIHCGELTCLIGPNGAGKSTLLKAILGEIPHTGKLEYLDFQGRKSMKPLIGYVPQILDFDKTTPVSVSDLFTACISKAPIWILKQKKDTDRIIESLKIVEAESLIDKKIGNLSGGELQRVLLALALTPIPNILLLDEPVSGIDKKGLELFYNLVSDLRKTLDISIILVSHDINLVSQYADRIILLNKEIKAVGKPNEVLNPGTLLELFGIN